MDWTSNFDLFCFDFDGLLVNTESLHHRAYEQMLAHRGYFLPWSFYDYCDKAHYSTEALRDAVYHALPKLQSEEGDWNVLREEKQALYQQMLEEGKVHWMPGAKELITHLNAEQKDLCVVTNSTSLQIEAIRRILPDLNAISHYLTREHYTKPKPEPDGYLKALKKFGSDPSKAIGFEDTVKGIRALQGAHILPVLICPNEHPQLRHLDESVKHFTSLESISLSI